MFRWLFGLLLILALAAGVAYVVAGRGAPPRLTIDKPDRVVGQSGDAGGHRRGAERALHDAHDRARAERQERCRSSPSTPRAAPPARPPARHASVTAIDRNQLRMSRPLGKQSVPELQSGAARIVVTATRPSFLNLRPLTSTASKDFQVRLEPPRIAVLSTHHYVNHGGSEMVVYRATPADVASGVRVGDVEYPGYPARRGVGRTVVKVAFFALLYDQDLNTPHRGVRARRSRQRGEGDVRRQRVREAVQEEPHRARRQVHQPRRAGDPRALAGAEDDGAAAGGPTCCRRS